MGITKKDVGTFISALIAKRTKETNDAINTYLNNHFDPVFNSRVEAIVGDIPKYAGHIVARFEQDVTAKLVAMGWDSYYLRNNYTSKADILEDFESSVRSQFRYTYIEKIRTVDHFDCGDETLNLLIELLRKDGHLQDLYKRKNALTDLATELAGIINASTSGKQAYNALVAHNVDMSDFEPTSKNLPAVIKLSADVCILNGSC